MYSMRVLLESRKATRAGNAYVFDISALGIRNVRSVGISVVRIWGATGGIIGATVTIEELLKCTENALVRPDLSIVSFVALPDLPIPIPLQRRFHMTGDGDICKRITVSMTALADAAPITDATFIIELHFDQSSSSS
jgi:hypothetical protein